MGGHLSKSSPEYQILRKVYILLHEEEEKTNGADGIRFSSETVEELKKLFEKSNWLKKNTHEVEATISQVPASRPVNDNKKLRSAFEVEVFDPTPSEATERFFTAFKQTLHEDDIIVKKITTVTDGKTPVILICNMTTRLEADMKRDLSSVRRTDYSRIVLIALHAKPERALPQEGSKEQLSLLDEKYQDLRGVVDIAFTSENKFYNCDMNNIAVREIRRLFSETV